MGRGQQGVQGAQAASHHPAASVPAAAGVPVAAQAAEIPQPVGNRPLPGTFRPGALTEVLPSPNANIPVYEADNMANAKLPGAINQANRGTRYPRSGPGSAAATTRPVGMPPANVPSGRYTEFTKKVDQMKAVDGLIKRFTTSISLEELCALSPVFQRRLFENTRLKQTDAAPQSAPGGRPSAMRKKAEAAAVRFVDDDVVLDSGMTEEEVAWEAMAVDCADMSEAVDEAFRYAMGNSLPSAGRSSAIDAEMDFGGWGEQDQVDGDVYHVDTRSLIPEGPPPPQNMSITKSWGMVAHPREQYLMVDTCNMLCHVEGVPAAVMIDDGSQVNVMPRSLFELICQGGGASVGVRVLPRFSISGVTGGPEQVLGHVNVEIEMGGVRSRHLVWVSNYVDKFILGMPFVWKNRVDVYWSGDRRVVRQNTIGGVTCQYMHVAGGPIKHQYMPEDVMSARLVEGAVRLANGAGVLASPPGGAVFDAPRGEMQGHAQVNSVVAAGVKVEGEEESLWNGWDLGQGMDEEEYDEDVGPQEGGSVPARYYADLMHAELMKGMDAEARAAAETIADEILRDNDGAFT